MGRDEDGSELTCSPTRAHDVRNEEDLRSSFEVAVQHHIDALLIGADGLTQAYQQTIIDLAARAIGCLRAILHAILWKTGDWWPTR
jgi:hypothetical protein